MGGSLGDHALDIQLPDDLPPVWVDASQVERVIANLLDNSAKYSPPGRPIGVVGRLAGDAVSLRIEDRGLGIPPEHMERIFEPFFREPTAGYPAKPGTGLGLAICRSIIRAHDGRIWAEQRLGGGAAFVFTLPIATGSRKG
jgi:two-component system sensor histidine kinase KdpD